MAEVIHKKPEVSRRKGVTGRKPVRPKVKREHTFATTESMEQREKIAQLSSVLKPKSKSELYRFAIYDLWERTFKTAQ